MNRSTRMTIVLLKRSCMCNTYTAVGYVHKWQFCARIGLTLCENCSSYSRQDLIVLVLRVVLLVLEIMKANLCAHLFHPQSSSLHSDLKQIVLTIRTTYWQQYGSMMRNYSWCVCMQTMSTTICHHLTVQYIWGRVRNGEMEFVRCKSSKLIVLHRGASCQLHFSVVSKRWSFSAGYQNKQPECVKRSRLHKVIM